MFEGQLLMHSISVLHLHFVIDLTLTRCQFYRCRSPLTVAPVFPTKDAYINMEMEITNIVYTESIITSTFFLGLRESSPLIVTPTLPTVQKPLKSETVVFALPISLRDCYSGINSTTFQ